MRKNISIRTEEDRYDLHCVITQRESFDASNIQRRPIYRCLEQDLRFYQPMNSHDQEK